MDSVAVLAPGSSVPGTECAGSDSQLGEGHLKRRSCPSQNEGISAFSQFICVKSRQKRDFRIFFDLFLAISSDWSSISTNL